MLRPPTGGKKVSTKDFKPPNVGIVEGSGNFLMGIRGGFSEYGIDEGVKNTIPYKIGKATSEATVPAVATALGGPMVGYGASILMSGEDFYRAAQEGDKVGMAASGLAFIPPVSSSLTNAFRLAKSTQSGSRLNFNFILPNGRRLGTIRNIRDGAHVRASSNAINWYNRNNDYIEQGVDILDTFRR